MIPFFNHLNPAILLRRIAVFCCLENIQAELDIRDYFMIPLGGGFNYLNPAILLRRIAVFCCLENIQAELDIFSLTKNPAKNKVFCRV
jgi:hypothetical protein